MKNKESVPAETKTTKESKTRKPMVIFLAIILPAVLLSAFFAYRFLNQPQSPTPNPTYAHLSVAIVDQLSLSFPDPPFIGSATSILNQANCSVDYYPGENVTVDFYKELSSHGYQLIILRVHAAGTSAVGSIELSLFTCENYSRFEHVGEQVYRQVGIVSYTPTSQKFFGISPNFVRDCMKERFSNTTIIMMGCDGLEGTQMAKAFIDKGAKIYMAWNSSITAGHTDTATENLLRHLVIERKTFAEAVQTTMKEIGPDPACQSYLTYYPAEAGQKKIDNTATAK